MLSIRNRLLIAALVLLSLFVSFTGWVLSRAFTLSVEESINEQLKLHIYSLLTAAEEIDGKLYIPEQLAEPRFNQLSSDLYGAVFDGQGNALWRSQSAIAAGELPVIKAGQGEDVFGQYELSNGQKRFYLGFGVLWEGASGFEQDYRFVVYENADRYQASIASFSRHLWVSLGGLVIILLLTLYAVLHWGLLPLQQVEKALEAIKQGKEPFLRGVYPKELSGLVNGLNLLIDNERRQRERYQNSLGDLAHSLKTPLAVIRGCIEGGQPLEEVKPTIAEQTTRMNDIVVYQLKRAAATTPAVLAQAQVAPVLEKLRGALLKVYRSKALDIELAVDPQLMFWGDESDLYEILGNLLDNACKHCRRLVRVSAAVEPEGFYLLMRVEDDGAGLEPDQHEQVLSRGVRADNVHAGQGIGLSVVREIATSYHGTLCLEKSSLGGLSVAVRLPLPQTAFG